MQGKRPDKDVFLSYIDPSRSRMAPGSFSRPYPHSANLSSSALDPTQAASPRSGRIEELLMQRHRASQSKLTQLKAKIQAEELREVRAAPVINATSRRLADAALRPPTAHLRAAKLPREQSETEQTLSTTKSEAVLCAPPLELRCHVSLKSGTTTPVVPAVRRDDDSRVRSVVSVDSLPTESANQCNGSQVSPDLLDMAVLDRQDFFVSEKKRKLAQQRAQREDEEVKDCTFRPSLTPRRSLSTSRSERSIGPTRSVSATRRKASYYERYMYTKAVRESSQAQTPNLKPVYVAPQAEVRKAPAVKEPRVLYQALSPTSQRISFRSGLNLSEFIAHARPMISYRGAEGEKKKASKPTRNRH